MKRDWKLYLAFLVLIGLIIWLIVLSLDKNTKLDRALQEIETIKEQPKTQPQVINGKTPIKGIDYFDGLNGENGHNGYNGQSIQGPQGPPGATGSSAYDTAVKNGFVGTEKQWLDSLKVKGDRGDSIDIKCVDGKISKKFSSDDFWNLTNIKCEVSP